MSARSGIVILDNTCYSKLESPMAWARFQANLRVADLVAAPSEVNLLEAIATSPPSVQLRLLKTIGRTLNGRPLLPWPFDLLKRLARAAAANDALLEIDYSGHEWYLANPSGIPPAELAAVCNEAQTFMADLEQRYSALHAGARVKLRRKMKERGMEASWEDIRDFLEEQWRPGEMPAYFAAVTWRALRLEGEPPIERLVENPTWSLFLDAEGVAVYARALAGKQPKKVQRADLIQLVYLAGADRRIIATADNAFLAAAMAIVAGHTNARAMHIDEMLT